MSEMFPSLATGEWKETRQTWLVTITHMYKIHVMIFINYASMIFILSMMIYGLYMSSFLIDQHNETEPAEETVLELTSEDSKTHAH